MRPVRLSVLMPTVGPVVVGKRGKAVVGDINHPVETQVVGLRALRSQGVRAGDQALALAWVPPQWRRDVKKLIAGEYAWLPVRLADNGKTLRPFMNSADDLWMADGHPLQEPPTAKPVIARKQPVSRQERANALYRNCAAPNYHEGPDVAAHGVVGGAMAGPVIIKAESLQIDGVPVVPVAQGINVDAERSKLRRMAEMMIADAEHHQLIARDYLARADELRRQAAQLGN